MAANAKKELMEIEDGGIASFLTSNMDEIDDSILAFGMPSGINSMRDVAEKMAKMGRGGDNVIIHSHTDEMLIPKEVGDKYPELIAQAKEAIAAEGGDPEAYIVGSEANSINPVTGQREFFLKKLIKGVKKFVKGVVNVVKKIAPVVLPMALNVIFPGMGAVASGAIGAGVGSLIQGKSVKDSLKAALMGGAMGGFAKGVSNVFAGNPLGQGVLTGQEGYGFFEVGDNFRGTFGLDPRAQVESAVTAPVGPGAANTPAGQPAVDAGESSWWNKTKELGGTAKDYLFPDKGALQAQNYQKALEAAQAANVPITDALKASLYEKAAPGMLRTYGPLAATGLGVAAAAGAFDPPEVAVPEGFEPFKPVTQEEIDAVRVGVPGRPPATPASSLVVPPSGIPGVNPPMNQMTYANYLAPEATMPEVNMPAVTMPQVTAPDPSQQIFGYDRFGNPIQSIYGTAGGNVIQAAAGGGIMSPADFPRRTGAIRGPGTETSDSVPAMLSDGEFVMNARAVRGAGNGNREAGMRRMYDMMKMFEGGAVAS